MLQISLDFLMIVILVTDIVINQLIMHKNNVNNNENISETQAKFSDVPLDSNTNTSTSIRTESGNPVAQSEDLQQNGGRGTTDRGKEKAETNSLGVDGGKKEENNAEVLKSGGDEVNEESGENGNGKRKKEEEDEGGGSRDKDTKTESVVDTYEKRDIEDGEERKSNDIREKEDVEGGRNEEKGRKNNSKKEGTVEKQGDQRNENDRESEDDENRVETKQEKEDGVHGRERKTDLGTEITRNGEGEKGEGGGDSSNQLNRFTAEGATSTTEKIGGSKSDFKKTVKVCFHAFLAPSVNFDQRKDELYVIFGPERNNWDRTVEGLMKFTGPKRYLMIIISFDLKAKSWLFVVVENALLREANVIKIIKTCMRLSIKENIIKIMYIYKNIYIYRYNFIFQK